MAKKISKEVARGRMLANRVVVSGEEFVSALEQKGFGEKKEGKLILELKEALYLMEQGKLLVEKAGEELEYDNVLEYGAIEENFFLKYLVYKDLRERGYSPKTGFKFGFDLRVYPRGKKTGEAHTEFVVLVKPQEESFSLPEMSRMVRMSQTLKTNLVFAVVDSENNVSYYKAERITP